MYKYIPLPVLLLKALPLCFDFLLLAIAAPSLFLKDILVTVLQTLQFLAVKRERER